MVFRGPHRSCMAPRAGCAEMAVVGTRSAAAADAGVKLVTLGRIAAVFAVRVGRRGVRVVNALRRSASRRCGERGWTDLGAWEKGLTRTGRARRVIESIVTFILGARGHVGGDCGDGEVKAVGGVAVSCRGGEVEVGDEISSGSRRHADGGSTT